MSPAPDAIYGASGATRAGGRTPRVEVGRVRTITRRLVTSLAALVLLAAAAPALAQSPPPARTAVRDVRSVRMADGGAGAVSFVASHDIDAPLPAGSALPGARIAEAAGRVVGDGGYVASWLAPSGLAQFSPSVSLPGAAWFANGTLTGTRGTALNAGDRFDVAVTAFGADAPLDWQAPRQSSPRGTLAWDSAVDVQRISARHGSASSSHDVLAIRADLVVRGGDIDARNKAVDAPPLVIDLPQTYPGQVQGGYQIVTLFPYTHYITGMDLEVLPALGKAVLRASVRGYLPGAREARTADGRTVRSWHLPITGVMDMATSLAPAPLQPVSVLSAPAGGLAFVGDGESSRRVELRPGDVLLRSPSAPLGSVVPAAGAAAPADATADAPANTLAQPSITDELMASAVVTADIDRPVALTFGRGALRLTVDPDLRGSGVLALRDVRRGDTGTTIADVVAVPAVRIGDETIPLTTDRLLDLRLAPAAPLGTVTYSGSGGTASLTYARALTGHAVTGGVDVEAVYDVGLGRAATVRIYGVGDTPASEMYVRASVRDLAGRGPAAAPIVVVEIPGGDVVHRGETIASEARVELDSRVENEVLTVGDRYVRGSAASADVGELVVTRAGGPLLAEPDAGRALAGGPVALRYGAPAGVSLRGSQLFAGVGLAADRGTPAPVPAPPLGTRCGPPQVVDPAGDTPAATGLDIREAWFTSDASSLYATLALDTVPTSAPAGTRLTYQVTWRNEHSGRLAQATLDDTGKWTFTALANNGLPLAAPATGEVRPGAGGLIRIAMPSTSALVRPGDLLRDAGARAQMSAQGRALLTDAAPDDAGPVYGTGGDHRVGAC